MEKVQRRRLTEEERVQGLVNEIEANAEPWRCAMLINGMYNFFGADTWQAFMHSQGLHHLANWLNRGIMNNDTDTIAALLHLLPILPCSDEEYKKSDLAQLVDFFKSDDAFPADLRKLCDSSLPATPSSSRIAEFHRRPRSTDAEAQNSKTSARQRSKSIGFKNGPDLYTIRLIEPRENRKSGIKTMPPDAPGSRKGPAPRRVPIPEVEWHTPKPMARPSHVAKEIPFASTVAASEARRRESEMEASYFNPSMIPRDPMGPPLTPLQPVNCFSIPSGTAPPQRCPLERPEPKEVPQEEPSQEGAASNDLLAFLADPALLQALAPAPAEPEKERPVKRSRFDQDREHRPAAVPAPAVQNVGAGIPRGRRHQPDPFEAARQSAAKPQPSARGRPVHRPVSRGQRVCPYYKAGHCPNGTKCPHRH